ncbi:WXG100 family type VII secretion target [Streptomyces sp. NPDC056707]|uniref:WXG100 family type VII secretion target n=1 Tax=Streptomyces sp. NPDC056707 TaxID=3345919 RepID=UPI00369942EB
MPGDGQVFIEYAGVGDVESQLLKASQSIDTLLDELKAQVMKWVQDAAGMDVGQFDGKFAEWEGYCNEAALHVQQHSRLLQQVAETWSGTDKHLAGSWSGLPVI